MTGNGFRCTSLKCTLAAVVYGLWQETNSRIFRGVAKGHDQVAAGVATGIRNFLSSRRNVKYSLKNKALCETMHYNKYHFL